MKINRVIRYSNLTKEENEELQKKNHLKSLMMVILGSFLYSIAFVWILEICGFFATGITGVSQLVVSFINKFSSNQELKIFFTNNVGTIVLLINVPLLLIGWKGVSKRFAIYTVVSLVCQLIFMNLLSTFTISPISYIMSNGQTFIKDLSNNVISSEKGLFEIINSNSFQFFKAAKEVSSVQENFVSSMLPGTKIILALLGGTLSAFGASLSLKGGGSTGGMDIIANYIYSKKRSSFTKVETIFDTIVIIISSVISVENVLYTLIRLYTYMLALKSFYKSYNTRRIDIITDKPNEIREMLKNHFAHSYTILDCVGGYTNQNRKQFIIYASEFEVEKYVNYIKEVDQNAFITISSSDIIRSNFVQHAIC